MWWKTQRQTEIQFWDPHLGQFSNIVNIEVPYTNGNLSPQVFHLREREGLQKSILIMGIHLKKGEIIL